MSNWLTTVYPDVSVMLVEETSCYRWLFVVHITTCRTKWRDSKEWRDGKGCLLS